MADAIIIAVGVLFFVVCICVIFFDVLVEPVLMRFRIGRKKSIARRETELEEREKLKAQWAAESTEVNGKYRAMCVKRTKFGRIVASYEIGDLLSINDENFSAKRMDLLTTARLRAEELNSEAL